jgi:Protein of unknown function (DUF3429)
MLTSIPPLPRLLGLAGLLPMAALLAIILFGGDTWRFGALAFAWLYAALIFSFVGGLWWGLAAAAGERAPGWLFGISIVPSLAALATLTPWLIGEPWPGPPLLWLALLILASPLIDRRIAKMGLAPSWWMPLRIMLSTGLGAMALVAGLAA